MKRRLRAVTLAQPLVLIAIVAADQMLKSLSWNIWTNYREPPLPLPLIPGVLDFTFAKNRGAVLGALPNAGEWFPFITLTVLILVLVLWTLTRRRTPMLSWALICVAGGFAGNFADRLQRPYVVDMFMIWALNKIVFNLADVFILSGCVLVVVSCFRRTERKESHDVPSSI